ncbi:MAG: hypothetical protein IJ549_00445 [Prevotella sp.]|nr:hypothetical protein [Prevotella sp.]MBQ8701219.1 hypothetical protein [Prevotella sp.]MBQ9651899.1 hypothetical protein [Prevotella sp.]
MKRLGYILGLVLIASTVCISVEAKPKKDKKIAEIYMYALSASFNDSTVYFTDIQQMRGVWMDNKSMFLRGSEEYANQLRNYLDSKGMPKRVCTVFYSKKYKKLKKRYDKIKNKYVKSGKYDIRNIDMIDFQFQPVLIEN